MTYCDQDPRQMDQEALSDLGHTKTPLMKVIRAKCLECCAGNPVEVGRCHIASCALWPYRMGGANPFNKRDLTDEQREVMAERARKAFGKNDPV